MGHEGFTTSFTVDRTPEQVYEAIMDVRAWWTGEIDGSADRLGAEFTYRYQDLHRSTQRVTELVPGKRVVWRVVEGRIAFVRDTTEWTDTEIIFDIATVDGGRRSDSRTPACCRPTSASTPVRTRGAITSSRVSAT